MTDLPPGWEWATLGELVDILDSLRVPLSNDVRSKRLGDVPYYGATGRVGWIDEAIFNEQLVLLGEDGVQFFDPRKPKAYLIEGPAWVNNHAHVLRASAAIESRFLCYYLNRFDYRGYANGTTRLKLTQAAMKSIPVLVPPLAEQRRIVAALENHLSRLDAGVAQLRDVLRRIGNMTDRVLAATCTGSLDSETETDHAPLPDSVGVVDGDLPPIPASWRWTRLGELAEVVGGVTKDSKKQSDPDLPLVPYLRVANVQRGRLDLTNISYIRVPPEKVKQLELRDGDVLLNEGGDRDKLGRGWIWEGRVPGCIHQNHVFRARIRDGVMHPKLVAWYANSVGRSWFEANGKQSINLASISLSKIKLLPVPVPPEEVQPSLVAKAEERLSLLDSTEEQIGEALTWSDALRRSLLSEAFSGRLVEQDPADEPASELLARIRAERETAAAAEKPKRARTPRTSTSSRGRGRRGGTTRGQGTLL